MPFDDMKLNLTPAQREAVKGFLMEGGIYQRLKHDCGFVGNSYHKVDGKWQRRTHCPQCQQVIKWIPIEEWIKGFFRGPQPPIPHFVDGNQTEE